MAEVPTIETRSRSRSKTPGLLASENGDHGKKGSKKIPTISLIEEEDDAVEIVPISQDTRPKRQRRNAKAVTSDTSGDVSEDSLKNSQKKNVIKSVTVESVSVVKTTNGNEESSEQVTTSVKSTSNEGSDALENQSIFNNIFTAIKTSTPILSNKSSKRVTQNAINSDVNAADHPAYKLYIEAGEYWNQYPKTDYTYSELSPHRRELSNGIVAMPNMSRRSLEKYHTRVENMIQKNPTEEGFLRRKFLSNTNTSFQKRSADLQYDSADEIDVSKFRNNSYQVRKQENFMSRFVSIIRSMFVSLYDRTSQAFSLSRGRRSYYPVRKQPGIFYKAFESLKKFLLLTFSKIYLLISSILCLDTWIVYNRSNNTMENRRRKRFMLTMLVLLPLLVLSGTAYYLDPSFKIPLPTITLPTLRLPKLSLPSFPDLKLPEINWPTFPKISLPSFEFSLPAFAWPTIALTWPPWLRLPEFTWPEWLALPEFTWPQWSFTMPTFEFEWPTITRPEWLKFPDLTFSIPKISLPSMPTFSLPQFNFDISPVTSYIGEKFTLLQVSSIEVFDKIREATFGLLNEAQIVWNENFNSVSNSN